MLKDILNNKYQWPQESKNLLALLISFIILNYGDVIITLIGVKTLGLHMEGNPLVKKMLFQKDIYGWVLEKTKINLLYTFLFFFIILLKKEIAQKVTFFVLLFNNIYLFLIITEWVQILYFY